jgi:hypothetical protein
MKNLDGPYRAEDDPCHIHWARHNRFLTYSECPEVSCQEYVAARDSGALWTRKYRGTDHDAQPEPTTEPAAEPDDDYSTKGML